MCEPPGHLPQALPGPDPRALPPQGILAVALQPALTIEDYVNPDQLGSHLDRLMGEALQARSGRPAVVLLPEDIGAFLPLGLVKGAPTAKTLATALERAVRARPLGLARAFARHPQRLQGAALASLGDAAFAVYHPMMGFLARKHRVFLAAGSLLLRQADTAEETGLRPSGHHVYQVAPVYDPSGAVVAVSRKANLVPGLETSLGLRAAPPRVAPFRVGPLTAAVMICFDACTRSHVPTQCPPFQPLWPLCDGAGVDLMLQPSANPAPWHAPWPYVTDGRARTEETAWAEAAVEASLARSTRARYAMTSFLALELFDLRFEGESRIFGRGPDGQVRRLSQAGGFAARDGDRFSEAVLDI